MSMPFSLSEPPAISELWRFVPRGLAEADCWAGCGLAFSAALDVAAVGWGIGRGLFEGGSRCSEYWSISSAIFVVRSCFGTRFILISSRDRKPCAWRAYCARSLRARSVTVARVRRSATCLFDINLLSNCRLSITACFFAAVIVEACCAESLSGVAGDRTATIRGAIVMRKIDVAD